MNKNQLTQITKTLWEIPTGTRDDMRVPARVYADERLLEAMLADDTLMQLMNVTTLPGVTGCVHGILDMHVGYGFPVGGVADIAKSRCAIESIRGDQRTIYTSSQAAKSEMLPPTFSSIRLGEVSVNRRIMGLAQAAA